MKNILITGGEGFLGGHIARSLVDSGNLITSIDHIPRKLFRINNVDYFTGDYVDFISRYSSRFECIFHCAGILGTQELFESDDAFHKNADKFHQILRLTLNSTPTIYIPSQIIKWYNIYTSTSAAVELTAMAYNQNFGSRCRVLKINNLFGPFQKTSPVRKIVPEFINRALTGDPIEIFGDGSQIVNLQFASDVAKRIVNVEILSEEIGCISLVTGGHNISVIDLAKLIRDFTCSRSPIRHLSSRVGEGCGTSALFEIGPSDTLHFCSRPLEESIRETVEFYKNGDAS